MGVQYVLKKGAGGGFSDYVDYMHAELRRAHGTPGPVSTPLRDSGSDSNMIAGLWLQIQRSRGLQFQFQDNRGSQDPIPTRSRDSGSGFKRSQESNALNDLSAQEL